MFFLNRKEVGKHKFDNDVYAALQPLDRQHGFQFIFNPKHAILTKHYQGVGPTPQWEADATDSLAWLLASTLPAFSKL